MIRGYLPFAQAGGQLLLHLISRLYERTSVIVTTNLNFGEWLGLAEPWLALDLDVVETVFEGETHDLGTLGLSGPVGDPRQLETQLLQPIERL